jgi:heme/copper-type cytochrome/quinol oxidase subunit 2
MKIFRWHVSFSLIVCSSLALAILFVPVPGSNAVTVRRIALDATQFAFAPGRVEVNMGDRVIFTVTASDVVHGFYLDGYGIERRVTPGIVQEIEIVADRAGKFRYRCSVSCGPMHPFMIGELVVGPNIPFVRASAMMLVLLGGMLFSFWMSKSPGETDVTNQES